LNTLSGYVVDRLFRSYAVVGIGLAGLIWLLQMLDNLERGLSSSADLMLAAGEAALQLPEGLINLLPVITVLATAAAMGTLQARSELTVMRVSGVSIWSLTRMALIPGLVVAMLALAALQWLTPHLNQAQSRALGSATIGESGLWHPWHGLWVRSGSEFLNVQNLYLGRIPEGINLYQFNERGALDRQIRADQALVQSGGQWLLENVRIWDFSQSRKAYFEQRDELAWTSFLSVRQLELLLSPPAKLPLTDLWQYVKGLKQRQQEAAEFEMVLWRRLALPLSCLVMVLAAMATSAVPLKSRAVSVRLVAALVLGLSFQLLSELAVYVGLVMHWPVITVALVPPAMLALFAWWLLNKSR